MDSFEFNKIIAAIILTVVVVLGLDKISDVVFKVDQPSIVGYKVDLDTTLSASASDGASQLDLQAFFASATVDQGKSVFKKCAACHSIKKGGKNNIGPALYSVVGRNIAGVSDYKYSKALEAYGKQWNVEELNGFLLKPAKWIKGNKMGFAGLKKEEDRASVILYLNANGDEPINLP
tara:strand:- start:3855 stop:4385 length:531 start_codon:yes stop_codon:yes gene_type:complete